MKKIIFSAIACLFYFTALSGPGDEIIASLNQKIDELQYELDSMDGLADNEINIPNKFNGKRAKELYIDLVNNLQKEINDKEQPWQTTRDELRQIKNWLLDTSPSRFSEDYFLNKFEINYSLSYNKNLDIIERKLKRDPMLTLDLYRKIRTQPFYKNVMKAFLEKDSDLFMQNIWRFRNDSVAQEIIDIVVQKNPIKMKRWVGTQTDMGTFLEQSKSPSTKLFTSLFHQYGRASKSFYFIDEILKGNLTADEANKIGLDSTAFRKKLIEQSILENVIAKEAIQERLQNESLKIIRPVNDLHETKDPTKRFASVQNLNAEEIYTYMVYAEQEIFTSTYNGFYDLFMKKLGQENAYLFLKRMNFNKYRTFIKMAAGYNKLEPFLATLSKSEQQLLMNQFVSSLEVGNVDESLAAAVNVADTFGSINTKELKDFFKVKMKEELTRVENEYNQHGIRIYSLLNGILAQSDDFSDDWMKQLVTKYNIPKINQLEYSKLVNTEGKIIQQVFFYDDDDGKASYYSFLPSFQNAQWSIQDKNTYLRITSSNKQIEIFANKPQFEFKGKDAIKDYFNQTGIRPSVVIHRGHSFYVNTTIETLTSNAKLVVLGSCGGYHNLTSVLDRSPDVHIISSKQIGTMGINDPMIRLINQNLVKKETIQWKALWNKLGAQVKGNKKNAERFKDYVPPHKNLGAIFIMAYNRLKEKAN